MKKLIIHLFKLIIFKTNLNFIKLGFGLKFLSKNSSIWSKKYCSISLEDKYTLCEVNNNIYMSLGLSTLANYISIIKKNKLVYFSLSKRKRFDFSNYIRESFFNYKVLYLEEFTSKNQKKIQERFLVECEKIKTSDDLYDFHYDGLYIGDLIYDQSLQNGEWHATINIIDKRVYETLKKSIEIIEALKEIEKHFKIDHTCFSHMVGFSGLIMRHFASKKIENTIGIVGSGSIRKFNKFNGERNPYTAEIPKKLVQNLYQNTVFKKKILEDSEKYFKNKLEGKNKHLDSRKAFSKSKKTYYSKIQFCKDFNLNPENKCAFIMLHAFNDFPNHFKCIYKDYFIWFKETLKIIKEINNINWIFKEHPSTEFYPINDYEINDFFNGKSSNISLIKYNDNFNSTSIEHIADFIITAAGTAALEFTYFDIPSIITSKNHFSEFGISYNAKDIEQYKYLLKNIEALKKPSKEKKELALIVYYLFYAVLFENNWNCDAFLPFSGHEDRLQENSEIVLNYYLKYFNNKDYKEYTNRLKEFISNENEIVFFRDPEIANFHEK